MALEHVIWEVFLSLRDFKTVQLVIYRVHVPVLDSSRSGAETIVSRNHMSWPARPFHLKKKRIQYKKHHIHICIYFVLIRQKANITCRHCSIMYTFGIIGT